VSLGVSLLLSAASGAWAQQDGGAIVIPGNAETNPAAAAEMAQQLKSASASASSSGARASSQPLAPSMSMRDVSRPSDYRAATQAADAAMRNAARALEAHADAADDAMDEAGNGMIVIPGPGQAKAATPVVATNFQRAQVQAPVQPAGMMKTSFTPAASREVTPVVITRDDGAAASASASASARGAKPIAAGAAMPVAGAASIKRADVAAPAQPQAQVQAQVQGNTPVQQDGESIRAAATAFLQQQAAGLPGKVEITVTPVFPRGLAACSALDPFMPTGARLWGRVTVGVRCVGERPWTLYVQARVSITATYYLAARAIGPGEVLTQADLIARDGDITTMPQAIITDPAQAIGATTLSRVGANLPLRTDMLRTASAVSIGQTVHVVADGAGFAISAEGSVMNNAVPGQQVRVKTAGGQIITGVVRDGQTVEIRM
jgi:flagellar basal body P-ring formation protein FlgA